MKKFLLFFVFLEISVIFFAKTNKKTLSRPPNYTSILVNHIMIFIIFIFLPHSFGLLWLLLLLLWWRSMKPGLILPNGEVVDEGHMRGNVVVFVGDASAAEAAGVLAVAFAPRAVGLRISGGGERRVVAVAQVGGKGGSQVEGTAAARHLKLPVNKKGFQ